MAHNSKDEVVTKVQSTNTVPEVKNTFDNLTKVEDTRTQDEHTQDERNDEIRREALANAAADKKADEKRNQ